MYYAQMYCYGMDNNHVGITGIRGCLGVVFAATNRLFAVHIPPGDPQKELAGAMAFAYMVIGDQGPNPAGSLYLFVNGRNRLQADDEARTIRNALGPRDGGNNWAFTTRVIRIMTNLGPDSGATEADSATIKVQRVGPNLDLSFRHVPNNAWTPGGNAKTGCYIQGKNGLYGDAVIPNLAALAGGWNQMTAATCLSRGIH